MNESYDSDLKQPKTPCCSSVSCWYEETSDNDMKDSYIKQLKKIIDGSNEDLMSLDRDNEELAAKVRALKKANAELEDKVKTMAKAHEEDIRKDKHNMEIFLHKCLDTWFEARSQTNCLISLPKIGNVFSK